MLRYACHLCILQLSFLLWSPLKLEIVLFLHPSIPKHSSTSHQLLVLLEFRNKHRSTLALGRKTQMPMSMFLQCFLVVKQSLWVGKHWDQYLKFFNTLWCIINLGLRRGTQGIQVSLFLCTSALQSTSALHKVLKHPPYCGWRSASRCN